MSAQKPRQTLTVESGAAAMSFVEIAEALGYRDPEDRGKKAVFMVYRNAMRKLKQRPEALRRLQEIAAAKDSFRRAEGEV